VLATIDPKGVSLKQLLFGSRTRAVIVLGVIALLIASSAALAAWLTTGSGTGKAKLGQLQTFTIADATNAPTKTCTPGGTCDLAVKITGTSGPLTITSVAPNGTPSNPAGTAGCASSSQSGIAVRSLSGLSVAVPAGGGDNIIIPDAVSLASTAPDACQGTTWSLPATVSASTP
jgi:hypothetical protein